MNGVTVYRSADQEEQDNLLRLLNQGAEGLKKIDFFDNNEILANAFGLFVNGRITRSQLETTPSERIFYHVNIPYDSSAFESLRFLDTLNGVPTEKLNKKLYLLSSSAMQCLGEILYQDSYVPVCSVLGKVSHLDIIAAMAPGTRIRLKSTYMPGSNADVPGVIHSGENVSVLQISTHDDYHSISATIAGHAIGNICDEIIAVIQRILKFADWSGPSFNKQPNKDICHAIWQLYEREFGAYIRTLGNDVRRLELSPGQILQSVLIKNHHPDLPIEYRSKLLIDDYRLSDLALILLIFQL